MDISDTIPPRATAGAYIKALGYIGLEVSSLQDWETFAQDVLAVEAKSGPTPEVRFLKMDSRPWRIILTQGPADDISFAGWEVEDDAALDIYADRLAELGIATTWGGPDDLVLRNVDRLLRFSDPNGVIHEAYVDKSVAEPFASPLSHGGFVTGSGGLGHVVFGAQNYEASLAFGQDVLGVGFSDTIKQAISDKATLNVTFMHVNERHHSIAYADRAGAKKLHHFMIEVERIDDVGLARDRHLKSGLTVAQDIGQHPNDHVISYYGVTPSGFLVEYGWGGVKVDIPTWTTGSYDRLSDWGHRPFGAGAPAAPSAPATPMATTTFARPAQGEWNMFIASPMGEQNASLVLAEDFSGKFTSMGETLDIHEGAFEGNVLSFKADATKPFPVTLAFSLTLTDSAAAGDVQVGNLGTFQVKGERALEAVG